MDLSTWDRVAGTLSFGHSGSLLCAIDKIGVAPAAKDTVVPELNLSTSAIFDDSKTSHRNHNNTKSNHNFFPPRTRILNSNRINKR